MEELVAAYRFGVLQADQIGGGDHIKGTASGALRHNSGAYSSGGRVFSIDDSGGHRQETSRRTRGDPRTFLNVVVSSRTNRSSSHRRHSR